MDAETRKRLEEADDPVACENPPGFDWEAAMERVRPLRQVFEALVGRPFAIDEYVQEASFFAKLRSHETKLMPDNSYNDQIIDIRFSSFGYLVSVWVYSSDGGSFVSASTLQQMIATLEQQGFQYIDMTDLAEPYTGKNKLSNWVTWGGRFFDYT